MKYVIYRFYAPHLKRERRKTGVVFKTEEEAQEYCSREDTHKEGEWFDGYMREED